MRNSISPELRDVDLLTGSSAWIFIPVHGKQHWSLAIIRLIGNECRLCHLDSHPGIHKKSKIFHMLTGAGTKELALDRCMVERLGSIATLDQVTSFELVFVSYLTGSMKGVPV
ncbi:hypothetical protein R1sor_008003 [Riccia sorocarpa]|uniref:Ubiquitin-like protease family profile domain-containing protein n=1 Tax=Riccia sorocarpa TaxID=122646 RepID=A0ABD3HS45_9MARC